MAKRRRMPSAGYTRSFSGETEKVAKCSNRYVGDAAAPESMFAHI